MVGLDVKFCLKLERALYLASIHPKCMKTRKQKQDRENVHARLQGVVSKKKLAMAKQYFASQGQIRTAKSCATMQSSCEQCPKVLAKLEKSRKEKVDSK
jgi:hypothetical protein